MYYNIIESGQRIRELRSARNITRQQLADEVGISLDAMRKIERGFNGARVDTLVSMAGFFHVSLDYLVCGSEKDMELRQQLSGLNERELQFIRNMVLSTLENMKLIKN